MASNIPEVPVPVEIDEIQSPNSSDEDELVASFDALEREIIGSQRPTNNSTTSQARLLGNNNDQEVGQEEEGPTFGQLLRNLLDKDESLISLLNTMIVEIESHRSNILIAKTTGVSVAGAGALTLSAGLILAPFTGGLSLIPTILGGFMAASGSLTSAGTDIANAVITKSYEKNLKSCQDERNLLAVELGKQTAIIDRIVHRLVEDGNDQQTSIFHVFKCIKDGSINLRKITNSDSTSSSSTTTSAIDDLTRIASNRIQAEKLDRLKKKNDKDDGDSISSTSNANLKLTTGIVQASATAGRIVLMSLTPLLDDVASVFFRTSTIVGRGVVQGFGVVVGLAFTAVDIVSLVHDWRNDHPLIPHLKDIVEGLKESQKEWRSMILLLDYIEK